ncbi:MAG: DUF4330 family protein [Defluviitaleaceae bacterium]|nr:DUF4330 family protein [Defluviitaleaceae bacterium]
MRKYRLFGLINPVDVLLVILVVLVVWAGYLFSAPQQVVADNAQRVRFTIELPARPEGFHEGIRPGGVVFDSVRGLNIGHVVDAYGLPFLEDAPDEANNVIRRGAVEGLEFTYIVVEAWAVVTDYATEIGQYVVRVNQEIAARSVDFAGLGFITSVEHM